MLLKICDTNEGVFKTQFRKQLLAACSVTIITLSHGIGIGWLAPMIPKLQIESPLDFSINIEQISWIASLLCIGGIIGNLLFGILIDYVRRKTAIYMLAIPHMIVWFLLYFATSVEFLYIARICAGITGGGTYVVIPIFISEIADSSIRGRLLSLFTLSLNTGIFFGYIVSSHLPYHLIPLVIVFLPIMYLICTSFFPETPQKLLLNGLTETAEDSLKFYRNYQSSSKEEIIEFKLQFDELKAAASSQTGNNNKVELKDFLTKTSLKAIFCGIFLMAFTVFCGHFALINYMSSVFKETQSNLHPDTNTVIIGVVQVFGTYMATILIDRYGRKILMIVSSAGLSFGVAALGMYVFIVEETDYDLSAVNTWLPLLLIAFIIFIGNIGVVSVSIVILVEILPAKIRSKAMTLNLVLLSVFAFTLLKVFPLFWEIFGLSATLWFCATVSAVGLFYCATILEETKGKSLNKD